jgi:hypothetical protein
MLRPPRFKKEKKIEKIVLKIKQMAAAYPGLPDFLVVTYQSGKVFTLLPQTIPNGEKITKYIVLKVP